MLKGKSPIEKLFGTKPDYHALKPFGCLCFPNLRQYNTNKLDFRSKPCTFLGYPNNQKEYKCLDNKGKLFISRHVVFNEHVFSFGSLNTETTKRYIMQGFLYLFYLYIPKSGNMRLRGLQVLVIHNMLYQMNQVMN